MKIAGILSFGGAWQSCQSGYANDLDDIVNIASMAISSMRTSSMSISECRRLFESGLSEVGWEIDYPPIITESRSRIRLRMLGGIKSELSAQIFSYTPDFITRWLFNTTSLAVRHGIIEIPILLIPMRREMHEIRRPPIGSQISFEDYASQLKMLSPLSINHKFLIIGLADNVPHGGPETIELPTHQGFNNPDSQIVDRSIEFPPEYQQAGLGILNFFSTYLGEKYPDQSATVRIEQSGLNVRMVVISKTGDREVIEKALHEYELLVTGKTNIESIGASDRLILDLRNEVRIAKSRIEYQQDMISLQQTYHQNSVATIDSLLKMVGQGLSANNEKSTQIHIAPQFNNSITLSINNDVSTAANHVGELLDALPEGSEDLLKLKDLEQSLLSITNEKNTSIVRSSPALPKLQRIIDELNDDNSTLRKSVNAVEQGVDIAKRVIESYGKIAAWCGLVLGS